MTQPAPPLGYRRGRLVLMLILGAVFAAIALLIATSGFPPAYAAFFETITTWARGAW
ncbi:galactitol-specific phosphotransferase system IIC component [Allocatelliglobosispora scoriae]|uniref:Galactitol-specific phosphotransferase system IIC component n=1 Tax=Allocatelliglobosispora scoriae TaxID=643052 RepID=A0A841BZG1_9ACTN|nr:hypothetical protein [Allocatelliglobosispora scoriae]MBB5872976.1 galactitol-specific phosphotransferase system IIC component [Allocatelliglobosispora scoriae]